MFFYKILFFILFISTLTNSTTEDGIIKKFKLRNQNEEEGIIRLIRDEDINESADVIRDAYLDDCKRMKHATEEQRKEMQTVPKERTRGALRGFKAEENSVLLVAEAERNSDGARLMGCIRVKLNLAGNIKNNGSFAQIGPFATRVDLHGSGIGSELIRAAEKYAVNRWKVCEMQLDAHGIRLEEGVVYPPPPLLKFYENRGYRRIEKSEWFDPETANYVKIPGSLCYLDRMVKDACLASETDGERGAKRSREGESKEKTTEREESSAKRKRMHQHNATEGVRNYAVEAVEGDEDAVGTLTEAVVDLAHEFGLIRRLEDDNTRKRRNSDLASVQPISLFPSPFPRSAYQQAVDVHRGMQKLYFHVSRDYEFLTKATEKITEMNELYRRLVKMMDEVQREGIKQPYTLFLTRSDYMVESVMDEESGQQRFDLKQIEMNIGSVVGSAMGPRIVQVHRQMLQKMGLDVSNLPENHAFNTLARGLFQGWLRFGDPDAVVVFAVLQGSIHRFDERAIEYELQRISDWQVKVVRMSSKEAYSKLRLDDDFTLRLSADGRPVAVVYSRSGPLPEWTEEEWEARRTIERSRAIKTSTAFSALSSSKRVQQLLFEPGMVEHFMRDPKDKKMVEAIRRTFVGLWGLEKDDEDTRKLVKDAIANPGHYVLKPQNEDGGHNYFDEELREKLQQFTFEERAAHTLMKRIDPMTAKNFLVRPLEEPVLDDVVVELGIFGFLLGDKRDQSVVVNEQHGYLVRTKPASSTEGGITAGGVYDSLNLF